MLSITMHCPRAVCATVQNTPRTTVNTLSLAPSCSRQACTHHRQRSRAVVVYSTQPDTEEQRSPLDAPQEWEAPQPSKRPDIFPEFDKPERVFLPKPLPGDPEMPDEEEEEAKKRTEPGDPDPEQKPGEPPEPAPEEPGTDNPEQGKPGTDIPNNPE